MVRLTPGRQQTDLRLLDQPLHKQRLLPSGGVCCRNLAQRVGKAAETHFKAESLTFAIQVLLSLLLLLNLPLGLF